MSNRQASLVVLSTIEKLKAEGSWCGETHVQKTVFLCQQLMGMEPAFKYILYKHGPYSFELSACLQSLIADGLVIVRSRPPYGPSLETSPEGKNFVAAMSSKFDSKKIDFMAHKMGSKNVGDLERLATAVYVNDRFGENLPVQERAEALTSLKPHVAVEAARAAFIEVAAVRSEAHSAI